MDDPDWTRQPPRSIILATDLSSRCDRALDRSAPLAKQWEARLVVLHVLDPRPELRESWEEGPVWRRRPDRRAVALDRVRRDLLEELEKVEVVVEEGEPAMKIEEVATSTGAGLIVTGVARSEILGWRFVGSMVVRLTRHTVVPILVVKTRPRPYSEILVATDFSASSRYALDAAITFFPDAKLTLLHAHDVPFSGPVEKTSVRRTKQGLEREAFDRFLETQPLALEQRRQISTLVEHGAPELTIHRYIHDNDVDLVVLGSYERSTLLEMFIGSTARHLVENAPADVLLIRDPHAVTQ